MSVLYWVIIEKKLNKNYTRMLHALLKKSWKQHPTKQQMCGYLALISQTIPVRQTWHAKCLKSEEKLIGSVLQWTPAMDTPVLAKKPKLTYMSSV